MKADDMGIPPEDMCVPRPSCPICLESIDYAPSDDSCMDAGRVMAICDHETLFHPLCIRLWLACRNSRCPVCRAPMTYIPGSSEWHEMSPVYDTSVSSVQNYPRISPDVSLSTGRPMVWGGVYITMHVIAIIVFQSVAYMYQYYACCTISGILGTGMSIAQLMQACFMFSFPSENGIIAMTQLFGFSLLTIVTRALHMSCSGSEQAHTLAILVDIMCCNLSFSLMAMFFCDHWGIAHHGDP